MRRPFLTYCPGPWPRGCTYCSGCLLLRPALSDIWNSLFRKCRNPAIHSSGIPRAPELTAPCVSWRSWWDIFFPSGRDPGKASLCPPGYAVLLMPCRRRTLQPSFTSAHLQVHSLLTASSSLIFPPCFRRWNSVRNKPKQF